MSDELREGLAFRAQATCSLQQNYHTSRAVVLEMNRRLKLITSGGATFEATHIRLFPRSLIVEAQEAFEALPQAWGKDLWLVGTPGALVEGLIAKRLVDKAFSRKDRQRLESAQELRNLAIAAGQWFEIVDTEIDADEGLGSIVAWGSSKVMKRAPVQLTAYEKLVWRPLPKPPGLQEISDFFVLYPGQDFVQIRTKDSEHSLRLSSIEAFSLSGD